MEVRGSRNSDFGMRNSEGGEKKGEQGGRWRQKIRRFMEDYEVGKLNGLMFLKDENSYFVYTGV